MLGFVAFLIWELTEKNPIVDLRVFRHRGFAAACLTLPLGFGAFLAVNVLVPHWLQSNMGYTATWAGYICGMTGDPRRDRRADRRQALRQVRRRASSSSPA